ncbi:hypothetical protein FSP39_010794 [Pinctada imbricata]|uniref:Uncharacterized protein n=1 Tax=Pinctada imbricata TaxID=66713 RepID=A0AA89BX12_PINIB|nr:hypothetical protein FSP39_010794 [Pinctada imbricata]
MTSMSTDIQNEDSDSEWDSTLDFTSPRQTGGQHVPKIQLEIEDEDFSRHESIKADIKPSSPPKTTTSIMKTPSQRSYSKAEESPPYNFRPAVTGTMTPHRDEPRPGKDRKGTTYDVDQQKSVQHVDSFRSVNSWDDSDADEKTLQELRQTFSKEKQKEQLAEAEKQKQSEVPEDGQMTNRSETTWKSWASFGSKRTGNRNKNNKKEARGVPVATKKDVESQQKVPIQRHEVPHIEGKPMYPEEIHAERESVTNLSEQPAMMNQPYIVKDEGVVTYYFGHGPLQYLEVEDEAEVAMMPRFADRLEGLFERIWQEFFGALRIVTSFFIILVVELLKYVIRGIIQPIVVGVFQTLGDYIMKPILSILFNGFIQPTSIFLWNCFMTLKHMFTPIGEILRKILREFATCCRSVRLVEINWKVGDPGPRAGPVDYNTYGLKNV